MDTQNRVQRKRNQAYDTLRESLLLGRITAGQRIREAAWAQEIGVSRGMVREALARLCSEGLVMEGPKTGYFAPRLDDRQVAEALEVRTVMELAAVDRICRSGRNRAVALNPLREACCELAWMISKGYVESVAQCDLKFHEALVDAAGNGRLSQIYRRLPPLHAADSGGLEDRLRTVVRVQREHELIMSALKDGDAAEAGRLVQAHLAGKPSIPPAAAASPGPGRRKLLQSAV